MINTNIAPTPAGFFGPQVNSMDGSSRLPFFPTGYVGTVKVAACKGITSRKGDRAFVAELEIVTSNMPDAVRVGGKHSWYQSLKEPDTAYPTCISFLYACLGLDPARDKVKIAETVKPKQDAYLNAAVGDQNILAGALVNLQTSNKKKRDGGDFTLHSFSPAAQAA